MLNRIIDGCRQRNDQAQSQLYQRYYCYVLYITRKYVPAIEDAREIVNDIFLKIFSQIDHYQRDLPFNPWIRRITVYTAIDHYRKHIKTRITHESLDSVSEVGIMAEIVSQMTVQEWCDAIQKLPPAYRAVINLYAIDGYNHREISDLLGISVGTSKSNLHKARHRLLKMFDHSDTYPSTYSGNN